MEVEGDFAVGRLRDELHWQLEVATRELGPFTLALGVEVGDVLGVHV